MEVAESGYQSKRFAVRHKSFIIVKMHIDLTVKSNYIHTYEPLRITERKSKFEGYFNNAIVGTSEQHGTRTTQNKM